MIQDLKKRFTYHAPKENQPQKYENIRKNALGFAELIDAMCPDSREKSLAITALEEVVMWANASIARNEDATPFQSYGCSCGSTDDHHTVDCYLGVVNPILKTDGFQPCGHGKEYRAIRVSDGESVCALCEQSRPA